jgi:hypothetical protein
MTDYRYHWWPPSPSTPHVAVAAESRRHGAALALRRFVAFGCDLGAPGAHVDVTDANGDIHTLLVEEVIDWLREPEQAAFRERERLEPLLEDALT